MTAALLTVGFCRYQFFQNWVDPTLRCLLFVERFLFYIPRMSRWDWNVVLKFVTRFAAKIGNANMIWCQGQVFKQALSWFFRWMAALRYFYNDLTKLFLLLWSLCYYSEVSKKKIEEKSKINGFLHVHFIFFLFHA